MPNNDFLTILPFYVISENIKAVERFWEQVFEAQQDFMDTMIRVNGNLIPDTIKEFMSDDK